MSNWTHTSDYSRQYTATDDPRLLLVLERDESGDTQVDGDVYAPAAWIGFHGYSYGYNTAGSTFQDDDAFDALVKAFSEWGWRNEKADRYLRIFHGVEYRVVTGPSQGDYLLILDTPAHRATSGAPASYSTDDFLRGDMDTWTAYVEGNVFGIGYALNMGRVLDDGKTVDLEDGTWDVEMTCWGFFGEDWARSAAVEENDLPDLPTMLDIPA